MKLLRLGGPTPRNGNNSDNTPWHIFIPFLSIVVVSAIVCVRFEVFRLNTASKRREKFGHPFFNNEAKKVAPGAFKWVGQSKTAIAADKRAGPKRKDETQPPEWIDPYRPPTSAAPPGWCAKLIKNPRERPRNTLYGECGRKHNAVLCADGKPMYFGSHNQDMYTYMHHFKNLRRPGIFLDIAANDPVSRSNTFFFEKCLGWWGVCVEANPKYHDLLHQQRTCTVVKTCVSDKVMDVTFVDDAGNGGILATNKNRDTSRKRNKFRKMTCVKTDTAILRAGMKKKIDWLSLDVEGHELFVLKGIDWKTTKISLITVENRGMEIRKFLQDKGYRIKRMDKDKRGRVKYGQMWNDVLFVHKSVMWGKPV